MGKILPILLAVIGLGAGVGGGIAMRPDAQVVAEQSPCGDSVLTDGTSEHLNQATESSNSENLSYVKLNNQFVVPIVNEGRVSALVVIALSIELNSGEPEMVYKYEPKLRDAFLQVLFDHANTGGFDDNFTSSRNMDHLRTALFESAQVILGPVISDVLVVDIVRQDT